MTTLDLDPKEREKLKAISKSYGFKTMVKYLRYHIRITYEKINDIFKKDE